MSHVELELERLAQIQEVMGARLPEILGGIIRTLTAAIEQLEDAIGSGELERAAKAAHAARNDALMIGAKQLLEALTDVETSAREGRAEDASHALSRVRDAWPRTRDELLRAAAES
jgi:HPt (histidine-containing phosphotransfer) domain-containing protein